MKRQLVNAIGKKVFTLLMIVAAFGLSLQANAKNKGSESAKEATVTYKGVQDKLLVFKVDFKNQEAEGGTLVITTSDNDVLYSKKFNSAPVLTDIYLAEVPENCKLRFTIKTRKGEVSQSFEINSKVKTIEEYDVKVI